MTNEQFISEIFTPFQERCCSWDAIRTLQCTGQKPSSVIAPEVHGVCYVWYQKVHIYPLKGWGSLLLPTASAGTWFHPVNKWNQVLVICWCWILDVSLYMRWDWQPGLIYSGDLWCFLCFCSSFKRRNWFQNKL